MNNVTNEYDVDFTNYEDTRRFYLEAISLKDKDDVTARRYFEVIVENAHFPKLQSGSLVSIARLELDTFVIDWMTKNKRRYKVYRSIKEILERARGFNPENTQIDSLYVELYYINTEFKLAGEHIGKIATPAGIQTLDANFEYLLKFLNASPPMRRREYITDEGIAFYDRLIYNKLLTPSEENITNIANLFYEAASREQAMYYMSTIAFARRRGGNQSPSAFAPRDSN